MYNSIKKLFSCKAEGCGMVFKDEDFLYTHEKKHEMQLNLNLQNKSTNMFVDNVDQTPSPTRLIKNCEEIGLFDDLKHVNPFNEAFRRAGESKQIDHHHQQQQHISTDDNGTYDTASANDCLIMNEDSLHTPQVFPNVGSATTAGTKTTTATAFCQGEEFLIPKQDVILSETILKDNHGKNCDNSKEKSEKVTNVEKSQNIKGRKLINNDNSIQNHAINHKPKNQKLPKILPKINSQNEITRKSIILPNTFNIMQPQIILELPAGAVLQSKPILLPKTVELGNIINPIAQTSQLQTQQVLTVKEKLKNVLNNTNSTSQLSKNTKINVNKYHPRQTKHVSGKKCNDNIKNESVLQRGREASSRYREKIKRQNAIKDKKCEELIAENAMLKIIIKELNQKLAYYQNRDLQRGEVCSSNNPSQNSVESVIQTSKTIKLPLNVPNINVQQNQQQTQLILRNNDTNISL